MSTVSTIPSYLASLNQLAGDVTNPTVSKSGDG
jgi:hypothetical protein